MRQLFATGSILRKFLTGVHKGTVIAVLLLVAGCNSGSLSDGLESAASNPQPSQSLEGAANTTAQNQSNLSAGQTGDPANQQLAAVAGTRPIAFLPVSNAPQSAVTQLAKSIRSAASNNGVAVVASVQQGAQYQVKGYFSALEDGSGTLLVYVWDVLDQNNKRVYRINGQEQTSSRSSDPWASVSSSMLDRVAQNTVAQLKTWLASRS